KKNGWLAIGTNGRSPGFTSSADYYPAQKLTIIILSNSYSPVSQSPIADDIAAMALGNAVPVPAHIVPIAVSAETLRGYEGTYRFGPDFFRPNTEVKLRLDGGELVLDWGNAFISALIPVGNGEFMDRHLWAHIQVNASGVTYSTSGQDS